MKQHKQPKRTTPYEGDDIAEYTHNNKTHNTTSNAFKDASYASSFEDDAEMTDRKRFIGEFVFVCLPVILLFAYFMHLLLGWLA
jgi:hypothetical protein